MTKYEEIVQKLRKDYGWSIFAQPAQGPTEQALANGMPVETIVSLFHQAVLKVFTGSSFYPSYEQASYSLFRGREYVELDTAIVLGLQPPDPPVENIGRATTVTQWLSHLQRGYTRQGYKDTTGAPWTENGKLRKAASVIPPEEWKGYEQIWELAILAGYIPVGLTGFDIAYAQKSPRLSEIRGLDAQKWLENLNFIDSAHGDLTGLPWPPQKPAKK